MLPVEAQTQPPPSAAPREDAGGEITSKLWLNTHLRLRPRHPWYTPPPSDNLPKPLTKHMLNPPDPPFTCAQHWTCTTSTNHVVGCASGFLAASAFPTTCVDASQITISGFTSSSWNYETAFCIDATAPACVTLLFPGGPPPSQFRCQPTATLISLLSVPWDVAASQGISESFPTATSTGESDLPTEKSPPPSTAESTPPRPLETSKTSPTTTAKASTTNPNPSSTGAIAGGIVGGIALLLLLALLWYLFRKNYPKKRTSPPFREPEYNPQYMQGYGRQISPKHIPIELTGCGHGGAGPSSGYPPADFRAQERVGFGLGSMMYVDGNGEHQPRKSMETVTEESAGGSSRVGESSGMGRGRGCRRRRAWVVLEEEWVWIRGRGRWMLVVSAARRGCPIRVRGTLSLMVWRGSGRLRRRIWQGR